MPIAYIQEFPANGDTSTTNYDAVKEKLNVEGDRPDGMIIHTTGFTEEGVFRIFDVWDSEEQHARFMSDRLMPIVEEVMSDSTRPHESSYKLHDVVTPSPRRPPCLERCRRSGQAHLLAASDGREADVVLGECRRLRARGRHVAELGTL
jgi:hypothetical protein